MKATICERVSGARLRNAVPPLYRGEIVKDIDPAGICSLILCAHNPRDVIHSAPLVKAFKKLEKPAENGVIVVGTVFTEEAKALAAQHGARIVALHKALWTDEAARAWQL